MGTALRARPLTGEPARPQLFPQFSRAELSNLIQLLSAVTYSGAFSGVDAKGGQSPRLFRRARVNYRNEITSKIASHPRLKLKVGVDENVTNEISRRP